MLRRLKKPGVDYGPHGPDGNTGEFCAHCTRKNSTNRSNNTVLWPCRPAIEAEARQTPHDALFRALTFFAYEERLP
ncbi:hypothetical protein Afil01_21730 [Actinorhabdospora filicis]|uniref:Uncharacterized protein n=1 Tax=Actinorhabdospora filicis TaxID=1785913 RepID=A0A9W6SMM2_9ACTN|nr:hypothetical protein Afil01_21730 [Actinorhabdospora filicis]